MKRSILFALAALALGGVSVAEAQSGTWYIAPRIGYIEPDSSRETDGTRSVRKSHRRTIGRSIPEVADPGAQTVHNALLRIDHVVCVIHDENIRRLPRWPLPRHGAPGRDGEISTSRIGVSGEEHVLVAAPCGTVFMSLSGSIRAEPSSS